jgi:archaellum component FlaC
MKRIIKSRLEEHMVDLYSRVDNLKKDIALIKNNHLKHMSCAIYKIEKKVDKILWSMITGMGALILTLLAIAFKLIK